VRPRLALLDHHRVAEHVREREAEAREPEDRERETPRVGGEHAEREPAQGRHRGGQEQVRTSPVAEEWHQVREKPVERLHVPGDADESEEGGGLPGAEPHLVLQEEEDGLGREARLGLG
jgi:hypothetical protein